MMFVLLRPVGLWMFLVLRPDWPWFEFGNWNPDGSCIIFIFVFSFGTYSVPCVKVDLPDPLTVLPFPVLVLRFSRVFLSFSMTSAMESFNSSC